MCGGEGLACPTRFAISYDDIHVGVDFNMVQGSRLAYLPASFGSYPAMLSLQVLPEVEGAARQPSRAASRSRPWRTQPISWRRLTLPATQVMETQLYEWHLPGRGFL